MKIFWAWQSDLPGKISRHFIRSALNDAIEELKQPQDIQEPPEAARLDALHLDHDRKGKPGSPDLAKIILEKIAASAVFVADVTPVGFTKERRNDDDAEAKPKPLMNPNVAIELGYSLAQLGDSRILMIMNTAFGTRAALPFDISHKAGPILYHLPSSANGKEIEQAHKKLVATLVDALGEIIKLDAPVSDAPTFPETPITTSTAFFSTAIDSLAEVGEPHDRVKYKIAPGPAFYLRIIPVNPLQRPFAVDSLLQDVHQTHVFGHTFGGIARTNKFGSALIDPANATGAIDSVTQLFRNGEIWGLNTGILRKIEDRNGIIPSLSIEKVFYDSLHVYAAYLREVPRNGPPYTVEAGITGIRNWDLFISTRQGAFKLGQIYSDDVIVRRVLNDIGADTLNAFLLEFFDKLYDQTGKPRPPNLYEFPSPHPYSGWPNS